MVVIIIWATGIIPCYLVYRWWWKKSFEWTVEDRKFALLTSLISWAGVLSTLICRQLEKPGSKEKANW